MSKSGITANFINYQFRKHLICISSHPGSNQLLKIWRNVSSREKKTQKSQPMKIKCTEDTVNFVSKFLRENLQNGLLVFEVFYLNCFMSKNHDKMFWISCGCLWIFTQTSDFVKNLWRNFRTFSNIHIVSSECDDEWYWQD